MTNIARGPIKGAEPSVSSIPLYACYAPTSRFSLRRPRAADRLKAVVGCFVLLYHLLEPVKNRCRSLRKLPVHVNAITPAATHATTPKDVAPKTSATTPATNSQAMLPAAVWPIGLGAEIYPPFPRWSQLNVVPQSWHVTRGLFVAKDRPHLGHRTYLAMWTSGFCASARLKPKRNHNNEDKINCEGRGICPAKRKRPDYSDEYHGDDERNPEVHAGYSLSVNFFSQQ